MLDFTSSLYLGLRHPSRSLEPWESLSTGAPAALAEPEHYRRLARDLARLQGCDGGVLGTSSLHLFWDLFGVLAREPLAVFVDAGAYPIACWGVERAGARGAVVRSFPHHDAEALGRLLSKLPEGRRPVVVCDGFCPACGKVAPLPRYLAAAQAAGGLLVVDDTQALGILGEGPARDAPFGRGGGGSLLWSGIRHPAVILITSLAKGFGAPLAVLSGDRGMVGHFSEESETRVHCSPPSQASVSAALRALDLNRERGEFLRTKLSRTVARFKQGLSVEEPPLQQGLFPFQTLGEGAGSAVELHRRLIGGGIRTVLHRPRQGGRARVSFLFNALHTPSMVERALEALGDARKASRRPPSAF